MDSFFSATSWVSACLQAIVAACREAIVGRDCPTARANNQRDNARPNCANSRSCGVVFTNGQYFVQWSRYLAARYFRFLCVQQERLTDFRNGMSHVTAAIRSHRVVRFSCDFRVLSERLSYCLPRPNEALHSR